MHTANPRVFELLQGTFTKDPVTGEELVPIETIGGEDGLDHIAMFMLGKNRIYCYRVYVDDWGPAGDREDLREKLESFKVKRLEPAV